MRTFFFGFLSCLLLLSVYNSALGQTYQYQFNTGQGQSTALGGGVRQYSGDNGVTGQSVELGGGLRQYHFSDGTQGQRQTLQPTYQNIGGNQSWKLGR